MSLENEREAINAQLNYLTERIAELEANMPSAEERAFLQNEKIARERATWAWQKIKGAWPFMTGAGAFGYGVYLAVEWFVKHFRWTGGGTGP